MINLSGALGCQLGLILKAAVHPSCTIGGHLFFWSGSQHFVSCAFGVGSLSLAPLNIVYQIEPNKVEVPWHS